MSRIIGTELCVVKSSLCYTRRLDACGPYYVVLHHNRVVEFRDGCVKLASAAEAGRGIEIACDPRNYDSVRYADDKTPLEREVMPLFEVA